MAQARSARECLLDIRNAIAKINNFLAGRDPGAFSGDLMLHDAIVHNLAVISEASRHMPDELKLREPQIPWRNVGDMGNWLRHGYDMLDDHILWDTVQRDLPVLREAVERLLRDT